MINSTLSVAGSCWIYYERATNQVWLADDAGTGWLGPAPLGSGYVKFNNQCSLSAADASSSGSGTDLTINISLGLNHGFAGAKTNYMWVQDASGSSPGWRAKGTWTVP